MLSLIFLFASFVLLTSSANGAVTLTTSYTNGACINTLAVLTCQTDTGTLAWSHMSGNRLYGISDVNTMGTLGSFQLHVVSASGVTITSTATTNVTTSGLSITCSDSSSLNAASKSVTIPLASVPSQPLNFINTSTSYNSVSLSWSSPTEGVVDVDYYLISVTPEPNGCPSNQCQVPSNSTTIDNLQHGTFYTFSIRAVNCAGSGTSISLNITIEAQEPSPPINMKACALSQSNSHYLMIIWECSPVLNELLTPPVTNYLLTLYSQSNQPPTQSISSASSCDCSYSFSLPVQPSRLYSISVSANNSFGMSTNNPTTTIYSSPNATIEAALVTDSLVVLRLSVEWMACTGRTATIETEYSAIGQQSTTLSQVISLPSLGITYIPISGLQNETSYSVNTRIISTGFNVASLSNLQFTTNAKDTIQIIQPVASTVIITTTVLSSVSASTNPQCTDKTTDALGIVVGIVSGIAGIAIIGVLIMFIWILCIKISHNKESSYTTNNTTTNTLTSTVSTIDSKVPLVNETPMSSMAISYNNSYGRYEDEVESVNTQVYAEIKDRPPAPLPYTLPLDSNVQSERGPSPPSLHDVDNPAYGTVPPLNDEYIKMSSDKEKSLYPLSRELNDNDDYT